MEKELEKRIEELAARCEKNSLVTATGFLTMAEQAEVSAWAKRLGDATLHLDGGNPACERKRAFFLPYWLAETDFDPAEYIRALKVTAYFGTPTHRDIWARRWAWASGGSGSGIFGSTGTQP